MGGKGSGNRTASNSMIANRAENVDPDANRRRIAYINALRKLPEVNLGEEEEVEERIDLFFEMCADHGMQPLVGNLAANFGMSYGYFKEVINGERPANNLGVTPQTLILLKKAYAFINVNYEQTLTTAKNPIPWIFLGKATLGWREAPNETVVTHKTESPQLSGKTRDEIAAKYKAIAGVEDIPEAETYELPAGDDN